MFIKVNGIDLFYQQTGQGNPIILLHGNGENHDIFDVLVKQLAGQYTVYAIDSRDHGQSSKVNTLSYVTMMEDVASFIQELSIQKPILYGFSDGGIIGLLLAIHYPNIFSKLIVSGANYTPFGVHLKFYLKTLHTYLCTKDSKAKMILTEPNMKNKELKKILIPTLVLAGSNDIIRKSHTKRLANHIPNSTLQFINGEGHGSYIVHSDKLYHIIAPFF